MGEIKTRLEQSGDGWRETSHDFEVAQLDNLERDGVNIHCINSSEFVVGKMTNFNGPVTIINSTTEPPEEDKQKEKIVIRDKVLSRSAAILVENAAEQKMKEGPPKKDSFQVKWRQKAKSCLGKNSYAVPLAVVAGLAVAIAITFVAVFYVNPEVKEENKNCVPLEKLIKDDACIYTDLEWKPCAEVDGEPIQFPAQVVTIMQTKGPFCFFPESCISLLKEPECDPAFGENLTCNFFVGGDGNVYYGHGWNLSTPLSSELGPSTVLICLFGSFFDGEYPTYPQVETTKALIQHAINIGLISDHYNLISWNVSDHERRDSIVSLIKKWPHFNKISMVITIMVLITNWSYTYPTLSTDSLLKQFVSHVERGNKTEEFEYTIYSKKDWNGKPATSFVKLKFPVPYVSISHSVTVLCNGLDSCAPLLRNMQEFHFSIQLADIAYNFLVDSKGNIYEGRGWNRRNSKVGFINGRNIDICFIGDYSTNEKPTKLQCKAVQALIDFGVRKNRIAENYVLVAHNASSKTLSPGKNVYSVIKNWPHFDPDPQTHVKEFE